MQLAWFETNCNSEAPALVWPQQQAFTYTQVQARCQVWREQLAKSTKQIVFHYIENTPEAVFALLGALDAGHCVALLDPELSPAAKQALEHNYRPYAIIQPSADAARENVWALTHYGPATEGDIHPDLSILLATSGSTGSPKFVRLSRKAVIENAQAIAEVLSISSNDIALAHLNFHYSYGLSVLTSHLVRGASIGFSTGKFTDRTFWDDARSLSVTHLPGVPYHHEIIHRLKLERLKLPSLKVITQAGGRLALPIQEAMHSSMEAVGGRFYVMYGQTEASPRMATLPHDRFDEKKGSVGLALPGGNFAIESAEGQTDGEIVYYGPNVTMGYAVDFEDLRCGDQNGSVLRTGDTGYLDDDGYLYVTGRASRMGKVFGWRINLDELEQLCENIAEAEAGRIAVFQLGDEIIIAHEVFDMEDDEVLLDKLAERIVLPKRLFRLQVVDTIPKNARDKTDYSTLERTLGKEAL